MATIEDLRNSIQNLMESEGYNVSIPGLDKDSILDNYVLVKHGEELSRLPEEEQQEEFDRLRSQYENIMGDTFDMYIQRVKAAYQNALNTLTAMATSISTTIGMAAVPAVLTVGSATSTANPAYSVMEAQVKVNNFKDTLSKVGKDLLELCQMCLVMMFPLPDAIIGVIDTLAEVKKAVNTIPTA